MRYLQMLSRIAMLGRATANPGTPTLQKVTTVENDAIMPALDFTGVVWTRPFTGGNAQGITTGKPATRTAVSTPVAGARASATLAADVSGQGASNVASTISFSFGDTAAGATGQVVLRDGATGVGTILWSVTVGPLAANQMWESELAFPAGYGIPGSATTAMTLEFVAAPSGTGTQSVTLTGYLAK